MKNLILLFFTVLFMSSCENVQYNNPTKLQAEMNQSVFMSSFAEANYFYDGNYFIVEGRSEEGVIELKGKIRPLNTEIEFGGGSENIATFISNSGLIYTTENIENGGSMIVTSGGTLTRILTGEFHFSGVANGVQDTINFNAGLFYEVPLGEIFYAEINNIPFNADIVRGNSDGTVINISGELGSNKIKLKIPVNVVVHEEYGVLEAGFSASVINSSGEEMAEEGTIIITGHSEGSRLIRGQYLFTTDSNNITRGIFSVDY